MKQHGLKMGFQIAAKIYEVAWHENGLGYSFCTPKAWTTVEAEHFDENLGSNKCIKIQNYQEWVESQAKALVNDNDVTEDNAENSALVEVIFPVVTNDYECAES